MVCSADWSCSLSNLLHVSSPSMKRSRTTSAAVETGVLSEMASNSPDRAFLSCDFPASGGPSATHFIISTSTEPPCLLAATQGEI